MTDEEPFSGSGFTMKVEVKDDLMVQEVKAIYWFENELVHNVSMERSDGDNFILDVDIPYKDSIFNYLFFAEDTSGNMNNTEASRIGILLVDLGLIKDITVPDKMYTGSTHKVKLSVINPEFLGSVNLVWGFGDRMSSNISRDPESDLEFDVTVPLDSLDSFNFKVDVSDLSGKWFSSLVTSIDVIDNIDPSIDGETFRHHDLAETGQEIDINGSVNDNVGLDQVVLHYRINEE